MRLDLTLVITFLVLLVFTACETGTMHEADFNASAQSIYMDLMEQYELRALLEGFAARRASERITKEEVELLRESCVRFDGLSPDEDLRGVVRENLFFHHTILSVAASDRLTALVRKVIELPLVYNSYRWYSGDQMRISAHYHRQITKALADRDADRAELVMKEHLFEARDLLVAHVQAIQAGEA